MNERSLIIPKKFGLIYLALSINLLLFRIALPFLEYLFVPAAVLMLFYFGYIFWSTSNHFILINQYFKAFHIYILTGLLYLISLTYTTNYNVLVFRESLAVLFFLFLFLIFFFIIQTWEQYQSFQNEFLRQILIISVLSSILGLTKYVFHLYGIDLSILQKNGLYPIGTSLKLDHNFFSLTIFFGMLLILLQLKKKYSIQKKILYQFLLFLLTITIFLSNSRRGLFLLIVFIILIVASFIYSNLNRRSVNQYVIKANSIFFYLIVIVLFFISFVLFIWKLPVNAKIKILNCANISPWVVKKDFTYLIYDYSTVLNRDIDFEEIQDRIWPLQYDPKDPASGWAAYNYTPVHHLEGTGSENIPEGTIGYKLDKTSVGTYWQGNMYSITPIAETKINHNESVLASVYCFVSEDYNGGPVSIIASGKIYGKTVHIYDLDMRNTWQKLDLMIRAYDSSKISISLRFIKEEVNSFESLSGYVIFAHPVFKVEKIDPKNPDSGWGYLKHTTVFPLNGKGVEIVPSGSKGYKLDHTANGYFSRNKAVAATTISRINLEVGESALAKVFCYVSENFDGAQVAIGSDGRFSKGDIRHEYNLAQKGTWQLLEINFIATKQEVPIFIVFTRLNSKNFSNLKGYVIFAYPQIVKNLGKSTTSVSPNTKNKYYGRNYLPGNIGLIHFDNLLNYTLPKIINSLTRKENHDADSLYITPSKNALAGGRIDRWRFAYLYFKQYSIPEKLFGGGFDYLRAYSIAFFDDPDHIDYPHNTLISSFLYSGILGGIIYLIFLIISFYYGFKYWKYHRMFMIFYIITFFFVFFSSNSHFELPLFTFLSIIPFFTKFIVEKQRIA